MAVTRTKRVIRRDWTRDEVKELKNHSKDKTRVKAISRALKCTPGAVRQKAYALGTPGRPSSQQKEVSGRGLLASDYL
jgi:hypothetical protein